MNVIISNRNQRLLGALQVDVSKSLNGEFTIEDIVGALKNFFYNKLILDITALKGYEDIATLQKLSLTFDMNKVIILLDDSSSVNAPMYLSSLVSMGIYNFTTDVSSIPFLIQNSNSYKDVARFQILNPQTPEAQAQVQESTQKLLSQKRIGVKNLTPHAGSTTLSYMLKKHIEKNYTVRAVEVGGTDFKYINDSDCESIDSVGLQNYLNNNNNVEVIIIDINAPDVESYCTDIIYLIEPGLVQLNRLIKENSYVFEEYSNKKLVLNRSVLNEHDVVDFERESHCKVFFNIPNIDDKQDNIKSIKDFLVALGFTRFGEEQQKAKGFSLFK